jgi:hypothetical protein
MCKFQKKPQTLAGFEPGIFCYVGGRDDHYALQPGQNKNMSFHYFFVLEID